MPGIADHVADLRDAFPQRAVTRETLTIYVRELSDLDPAALGDAVRLLIRTSEFFPTIHAIRETVAEAALDLPSEAAALAEVNALGAGRPGRLTPLVREALDAVGGPWAVRTASEPGVIRGQFLRIYRDLRHARVAEYVARDALPPAAPVRELTG
jgi:hypothetical protein